MATVWSDCETMNKKLKKVIDKHAEELDRMNSQRRLWLYASSVVVVGILILMFSWDWLDEFHSKSIWWLIVSSMLIVSVNWWYWTVKVVKRIIDHQRAEIELIGEIITDIKEVKIDIRELAPKNVDNPK